MTVMWIILGLLIIAGFVFAVIKLNAYSEITYGYTPVNMENILLVLAPDSFGHPAGVDVDSAPESMWTLRRSTCGQLSLQTGT